jgi:cyanophycin synthetase
MNLTELIHQHAKDRADGRAVIIQNGNISWSELDGLLWTTAARLATKGLVAGDRVGLAIAHPVIHFLTSMSLARLGVSHVAVPIPIKEDSTREVFQTLQLKAVICADGHSIPHHLNPIELKTLEIRSISSALKRQLSCDDGNRSWLILQSSGTTGAPKHADLTHSIAYERFDRFQPLFDCNQGDIFWAASHPSFVVAKQRLAFNLMAGSTICLPTSNIVSESLVHFLNHHKVTVACGTPSHLHQLISIAEPIPSLRCFEARSAFINEKLRLNFKSKINKNLYIVYGTNEGEALTLASPTMQDAVPDTVGSATQGVSIEIVDSLNVPRPCMETGEIRVRGPGIISKYLNNPEASSKSFIDGWFYPGDLGYLTQDGLLVLQGRKDDMMIFDGINIYPIEIENALSAHPAVVEVAAFSIKHDQYQDVPVAAVTLKEAVSENALIDYSREKIGVKHPRKIVVLKEFPRNEMGKILKRQLRENIKLGS